MVQSHWIGVLPVSINLYQYLSNNCTPKYLSNRNKNLDLHKDFHMNAHNSFIHNNQTLQTTIKKKMGNKLLNSHTME